MSPSFTNASRQNLSRFIWLVPMLQVCLDLFALALSASVTFEIFRRFGVDANLLFNPYIQMIPAVFLFPLAYALSGLYPGFGLGAVEELRRLSKATFLTYGLLASSTFFFRGGEVFSRVIFIMLLALSLLLVEWSEILSDSRLQYIAELAPCTASTMQVVLPSSTQMPHAGLPTTVLEDRA